MTTPEDSYRQRLRAAAQPQLGTFLAEDILELPAKLDFVLHVKPKAKGRHRGQLRKTKGGKSYIHHHPDQATIDAEKHLRSLVTDEIARQLKGTGIPRKDTTLVIDMVFQFATKQRERWGYTHDTRPDKDNLAKLVLDALQGLLYIDDCQVVDGRTTKVWGREHLVRLSVAIHAGPVRIEV